jgi:hypothetical protein
MAQTKTPGGPELAITDPFEVTHRDSIVAGLYEERRGYEIRVDIAEAEGNEKAAAHMRTHIAWVDDELKRFGEDVSAKGRKARAETADSAEEATPA